MNSFYSCLECGGVLWEIQEDELVRYRCQVGHAFSMDSMLAGQSEALEDAIWVAFKIVQEQAALAQRMAEQMRAKGHTHLARRYEERQQDSEQRAALLLKALKRLNPMTPEVIAEANTVDISSNVDVGRV